MRSTPSRSTRHTLVPWSLLIVGAVGLAAVSFVANWAEAQVSPDDPIRIIALGDAYTAGVGAGDYYPGQGPDVPWTAPGGVPGDGKNCFQSYSNYPSQLAAMLNDDGHNTEVLSVGCIDATVEDVVSQAELVPSDWWDTVDLVLISIGANNAGLPAMAKNCLVTTFDCGTEVASAQDYVLNSYENDLRAVLADVSISANPTTKVAVVGYPNLASPVGSCADNPNIDAISALYGLIDDALVSATSFDGAWYPIVVSEAFAGHGPCALPEDRFVNNLVETSPNIACGTVTVNPDFPSVDISCESFHPLPIGHGVYAHTVFNSPVIAQITGTTGTPTPTPTPTQTPAPTPTPTPVPIECSEASAGTQSGLTNIGFETGDLSGWTITDFAEGVCVTAADEFTTPYEGSKMARLGTPQQSSELDQPPGINEISQTFVVTDSTETFAYNIFTYDYTGFDDFRYRAVVEAQDGEIIAAFQAGAWGTGTALKSSGWRGATLDLSDHFGETVTLSISAGGTHGSAYAFWVYIDSAETGLPTQVAATADVTSATGSVTTDLQTGKITATMPTSDLSDLTVTSEVTCPSGTTVSGAILLLGGASFPMQPGQVGGSSYVVTIPAGALTSGELSIQTECSDGSTFIAPIGELYLYDPSGLVTDATTALPVEGATVTLYQVPGWTPGLGGAAAQECQNGSGPWTQPAPTALGVLVSPYGTEPDGGNPDIEPDANPQITSSVGRYGWDVATGCWYVVVEANGYITQTSPVVGVPPAVTTLDIALVPVATPTPTATAATPTPTTTGETPTATPTGSPATATPTTTASPTETPATPTPTTTATPATPTPAPTTSATPTPTGIAATPTATGSPTPSPTGTPTIITPSPTATTATPTPAASGTPLPVTPTPEPTTSATPTPTPTPEALDPTATPTPSPTATAQTGRIVIAKVVNTADGEPSDEAFTFAGPNGEGFTLSDGDSERFDVAPGVHSVREIVKDGWILASASCSDGSKPTRIDISAGEVVTCTFTNDEIAPIGVGLDVVTRWVNAEGGTTEGDGITVDPDANPNISWVYTVTNTGAVALDDLVLVDDVVGTVDCPNGPLAVGASMVCTFDGTVIAPNAGETEAYYLNNATVTATADGGESASATATSSYISKPSSLNGEPSIDLDKVTNGHDGLTVIAGTEITWTYVVANTGDGDLTDISVTDDKEGPVPCPLTTLGPAMTMTCALRSTATVGDYLNVATVSARDIHGSVVQAIDASNYVGVASLGPTSVPQPPDSSPVPQPPDSAPVTGATITSSGPASPLAGSNSPLASALTPATPIASPSPGGTTSDAKGDGLAITGTDTRTTIALGSWLMFAGAGLIWLGRRRREN